MFSDAPVFSCFSVDNTELAREFYSGVLGFNVEDTPVGLHLHTPAGTTIYLYTKENHRPATYTMLIFPVPDIDKAVDELIAKGVRLERYEYIHQDEKGISRGRAAGTGPDIAWFTDPARNILAVIQEN